MTVWCAGLDEAALQPHPNLHTKRSSTQTDNTKCRITKIIFPDDGHMAARNMYRIEINIPVHEKELFIKLVIYKDYTELHAQENIPRKKYYTQVSSHTYVFCKLNVRK